MRSQGYEKALTSCPHTVHRLWISRRPASSGSLATESASGNDGQSSFSRGARLCRPWCGSDDSSFGTRAIPLHASACRCFKGPSPVRRRVVSRHEALACRRVGVQGSVRAIASISPPSFGSMVPILLVRGSPILVIGWLASLVWRCGCKSLAETSLVFEDCWPSRVGGFAKAGPA